MRIHADDLSAATIHRTLSAAIDLGLVAPSVNFKTLTQHGSRSRVVAFEIQLESAGKIPGDGRRRGNSGAWGSASADDVWAATYDEWGWFLSLLFQIDPSALVMHQYDGREDFHIRTTYNFAENQFEFFEQGVDPFPWVHRHGSTAGRTMPRLPDNARNALESYGWQHAPRVPRSTWPQLERLASTGGQVHA